MRTIPRSVVFEYPRCFVFAFHALKSKVILGSQCHHPRTKGTPYKPENVCLNLFSYSHLQWNSLCLTRVTTMHFYCGFIPSRNLFIKHRVALQSSPGPLSLLYNCIVCPPFSVTDSIESVCFSSLLVLLALFIRTWTGVLTILLKLLKTRAAGWGSMWGADVTKKLKFNFSKHAIDLIRKCLTSSSRLVSWKHDTFFFSYYLLTDFLSLPTGKQSAFKSISRCGSGCLWLTVEENSFFQSLQAQCSWHRVFSLVVLNTYFLPLETCRLFIDKRAATLRLEDSCLSGIQLYLSETAVSTNAPNTSVEVQCLEWKVVSPWDFQTEHGLLFCSCTEMYLGLSISLQANSIKCKQICKGKISQLNIWAWESANLLLKFGSRRVR